MCGHSSRTATCAANFSEVLLESLTVRRSQAAQRQIHHYLCLGECEFIAVCEGLMRGIRSRGLQHYVDFGMDILRRGDDCLVDLHLQ